MQSLDLVSALHMIGSRGLGAELNPLARAIFNQGGQVGLLAVKVGAVVGAVLVILTVARQGRVRLAAYALFAAAMIGAFGFYSNQA
jgi:hypothetical protein